MPMNNVKHKTNEKRMSLESKREYMDTMRKEYRKASKKQKSKILDEYCKRSKEDRKYAIKKFNRKIKIKDPRQRKKRACKYKGDVIATLVELWDIFDNPCGQRLKPMLEDETERLRKLGEIVCSQEVLKQLQTMSSSTIDRKLKHEKQVRSFNLKHKKRRKETLLSLVPTKTATDLDKSSPGTVQMDCVEHCGVSTRGEYVFSLATVDIYSGWWEAEAVMGAGQRRALAGMRNCKERFPVDWREVHPDNGSNILNWHVYEFTRQEGVVLSRSRPYKKNDNCYIEQKNSTHVRRQFGYLRFDTQEELDLINDLYRNELRLYKNYFQPVMKLLEKVKVKGKSHRKYDKAKTPYKRLLESGKLSADAEEKLQREYESLNPAELKRKIDEKLRKLYKLYKAKTKSKTSKSEENDFVALVSNYMIQ